MWVNVPYISDQNFADNEFNQPNPGPIWAEIEADFTAAMANLPASRGGSYSSPGRPVKSTAQAYLGKAQLHQGKWHRFFGRRLSEVTLGIIGVGRIGGRVLRRTKPFGTPKLLVNDIFFDQFFF